MKKILAVLAALWFTVAHADVITFRYTGTVTYATYMALPGAQVSGRFTYDTNLVPYFKGHPMIYAYSDPSPVFGFSGEVGAHRFAASGISIDLLNNFGNPGLRDFTDSLSIYAGYPLVVDGTTYASGSAGVVLGAAIGDQQPIAGFRLPRGIDISAYPRNYGWVQMDGGPTGQLLQFSVDSVEVESVAPSPR